MDILVDELSTELTTILNSEIAIELYAKLLVEFAKVLGVTVSPGEAEQNVKNILNDLEYSIDSYIGALDKADNYMESVPTENEILVNYEWLSKIDQEERSLKPTLHVASIPFTSKITSRSGTFDDSKVL